MVSLRSAPLISSTDSSSPPKYFSSSASSVSATASSSLVRYSSALSASSAGMSMVSYVSPQLGLAPPHLGVHLDQVDDALELTLRADRQLDRDDVGAEALLHRAHREVEVRTDLVHLVDEANARDVVLVGLAPDLLGLRLHAFLAVEHGNRTVEDPQAALHLDGEVDVPGGVDDVDLVVVPEAGGSGGGDGDPPLLLLLHPVHGGGAVVHLTDLVADTGVVEDALGRRRLTGIDVRHDADVADLGQVGQHVLLCHRSLLFRLGVSAVIAPAAPVPPAALTSGSARRRGLPRPSCGCPHAA